MSYIKKCLLITLLLSVTSSLFAQGPAYRWEQGFSLSKRLTPNWQANGHLKARTLLKDNNQENWGSQLLMVDVRGYLTYSLFNGSKITLGYLSRINNPLNEGTNEKRLIEQFATFHKLKKYRFTHKIAAEQHIESNNYIGRYRYAFSIDAPLSGENLDRSEMYFFAKSEILYSMNSYSEDLESRYAFGIGKMLKNSHRIQIDLETRWSDLLSQQDRLTFQLNTTYYISY